MEPHGLTLLWYMHSTCRTQAMMMDTKLNKMQHSEGELKKMIEAYKHWGPNCSSAQGHDFWTEKKPPKKLLNCR